MKGWIHSINQIEKILVLLDFKLRSIISNFKVNLFVFWNYFFFTFSHSDSIGISTERLKNIIKGYSYQNKLIKAKQIKISKKGAMIASKK